MELQQGKSKIMLLACVLLVFSGSAAAFTTGNYWIDSNFLGAEAVNASDDNYEVVSSSIQEKSSGAFAFLQDGGNGIQPGEKVSFCTTVQAESSSSAYVYFQIYVWSDYNPEYRYKDEIAVRSGSSEQICVDVTAPSSKGTYNVGMYNGCRSYVEGCSGGEYVHGEQMKVVEDSDGDGFIDSQDECPDTAGDLNGCPDSDNDGIKDSNDACPQEHGIESLNGCANTSPEVSVQAPSNISVNESFSVSADVTDPETSQSISIKWGNGKSGTQASYKYSSTGSKTVSVTVSDGVTDVTTEKTVNVYEKNDGDDVVRDPSPKNSLSVDEKVVRFIGNLLGIEDLKSWTVGEPFF